MHIRRLTDKEEILDYLKTDQGYAAYAIGDLDQDLFELTEWAGAEENGKLQSLVLLYKGLNPPALFFMGEREDLAAILRRIKCLGQVFLTCRDRHLRTVRHFFDIEMPNPMWRLTVTRRDFRPADSHDVMSLSAHHIRQLEQLYAEGGGDAFGPTQVTNGVFFGVSDRDQIISAAGTHLVSPIYGLAAVGNVYTAYDYRGRGYGTATTSAVVAELFRRGLDCVFLNVAQTNAAAIQIYERLGFTKHCPFVEMLALRKDN
jgi:ribosomal protein S18 acetylase RimI-like enzyme